MPLLSSSSIPFTPAGAPLIQSGNVSATIGGRDWLSVISHVSNLGQSWWSVFHPPVTQSGPVVDWAQQQQQQQQIQVAQRERTGQVLLVVGVGGLVLWMALKK